MIILGIDTSCDDTSAAVVLDGQRMLSNVIHSQVKLHHAYGGVVPELASREHVRNIMPVVRESLLRANVRMRDLDGIAVTVGPGLVGALLVGLYYAKCLAYVHQIPLVAVNHLEGHILSIFLEKEVPLFPFVALTVSGGHTSVYTVEGYGRYTQMGQTLDDAAGEAFDKVAKILGLGYPGGVPIEKTARDGRKDKIHFPRAYLSNDSLNFSFSGLKTAVALYVKKWRNGEIENSDVTLADIASSFQESVVDVLVNKVMRARKKKSVSAVMVAGGVACNNRLRTKMLEAASAEGVPVYFPRPEYCTDNAAMIAVAGYHRIMYGERADLSMDVRSKYPIQDLSPMKKTAT
jgi:N6-L-threonylcarbamoyladenine synthase